MTFFVDLKYFCKGWLELVLKEDDRLDPKEGCAFLVGNGINLYKKSYYDWYSMLKEVFPNSGDKIVSEFMPLSFDVQLVEDNAKRNEINQKIVNLLRNVNQSQYYNFVQYAIKNQCPILTTNFDQLLVEKGFSYEQQAKLEKGGGLFVPFKTSLVKYARRKNNPLDCYYSNEEIKNDEDIKKKFAIWHIHGTMYYQNSLCLGMNDYLKQIERLKPFLFNAYQYKRTDVNLKQEYFTLENTWVGIFLNCNLIIFGLGLDQCELDLYWLLSKKIKLYKDKNEKAKIVYYVYNEESKRMTEGKKHFLESLGVKLIPYQSYEDIYNEYKIFKGE